MNRAAVLSLALIGAILAGCSDPKVPVVQSSQPTAPASASTSRAATEITCNEFNDGIDGGTVDITEWAAAVYGELAAERGVAYDSANYGIRLRMQRLKTDVSGYCIEPRNWESSARAAAEVLVDTNPKDYWPETL